MSKYVSKNGSLHYPKCLIGLHDPPIFAVYAYIHMYALCILMGSICIPSDMYNTTLAGTTLLAALLQAYLQQ